MTNQSEKLDEVYAQRLAQQEASMAQGNYPPGNLPPGEKPPQYLPQYSDNKQQFDQHMQQQPPILYTANGTPLIPIVTQNGMAQIGVESHRLPPRKTKQSAMAGYPGASTDAIIYPQDHSVTYRVETVPLGEAMAVHSMNGGVRVEEPYNTWGSWFGFYPQKNSQQNTGRKRRWW
ncbi:hypothetical protein HDU98_010182 [Podochytrium sp. JEL0797]|nr:hypothetical protein HDU98_010182 [Podochytrium sp. JEL0797]